MTAAALIVLVLLAIVGMFLVVDGFALFVTGRAGADDAPRAAETPAGQSSGNEQSILGAEPAATRVGRRLQLLLQRADMHVSQEIILGAVVASIVIVIAAAQLLLPIVPLWAQSLLALAVGPSALIIYMRVRGQRRTERFLELFPDALDLIVRSLRIGHPVSVAMATVGNEMPEPIGKEFRIVAQQIAYGMSPPQAVDALSRRIAVNDVRFFAVTIQIQYETGGNLSEILESLSAMIRSRFQLFRKVKAITAEGRFSAWFLTLLPIVMIFIINYLQPDYYRSVSDVEYYVPIVTVTLLMLVLNAVVARWVTRLKV
jgi:tight adherence protein B